MVFWCKWRFRERIYVRNWERSLAALNTGTKDFCLICESSFIEIANVFIVPKKTLIIFHTWIERLSSKFVENISWIEQNGEGKEILRCKLSKLLHCNKIQIFYWMQQVRNCIKTIVFMFINFFFFSIENPDSNINFPCDNL